MHIVQYESMKDKLVIDYVIENAGDRPLWVCTDGDRYGNRPAWVRFDGETARVDLEPARLHEPVLLEEPLWAVFESVEPGERLQQSLEIPLPLAPVLPLGDAPTSKPAEVNRLVLGVACLDEAPEQLGRAYARAVEGEPLWMVNHMIHGQRELRRFEATLELTDLPVKPWRDEP